MSTAVQFTSVLLGALSRLNNPSILDILYFWCAYS